MKTNVFVNDSIKKSVKIGRVFLRANNQKDGAIYYNSAFKKPFLFIPRGAGCGYSAESLRALWSVIDNDLFFQGRFYIDLNRKARRLGLSF